MVETVFLRKPCVYSCKDTTLCTTVKSGDVLIVIHCAQTPEELNENGPPFPKLNRDWQAENAPSTIHYSCKSGP